MSKIGAFWGAHFIGLEWGVSVLIAGAYAAWLHWGSGACADVSSLMQGNRSAIYGALAAIFGSLLGFGIAALSIAMAFSQDAKMKMVRDSDYYGTMWNVFITNIRGLSIGTVGALLGLIVDKDQSPAPLFTILVVWTTALAVARVARCIWLLEKLVLIVRKHRPAD